MCKVTVILDWHIVTLHICFPKNFLVTQMKCKCKLKYAKFLIHFCIYWVTSENVKKVMCKNMITWSIVTKQWLFSFTYFFFGHYTFRSGGIIHIFCPRIGNDTCVKEGIYSDLFWHLPWLYTFHICGDPDEMKCEKRKIILEFCVMS